MAGRLDAIGDVSVFAAERLIKRAEDFGRFLQVDIDEKHEIASGVLKSGHHRFMMTKIPR